MKKRHISAFLALALIVTALGALAGAIVKQQKTASTAISGVETNFRKLANGAVVYEEHPDAAKIEDIAPAAGGNDPKSGDPKFYYDRLTQTYRVRAVDSHGNTRQDIISNPLHP